MFLTGVLGSHLVHFIFDTKTNSVIIGKSKKYPLGYGIFLNIFSNLSIIYNFCQSKTSICPVFRGRR